MPCIFAFVEVDFVCAWVIVYAGNDWISNYPFFKRIYGKNKLSLRFVYENCVDDCFDFQNYFFNEVLDGQE